MRAPEPVRDPGRLAARVRRARAVLDRHKHAYDRAQTKIVTLEESMTADDQLRPLLTPQVADLRREADAHRAAIPAARDAFRQARAEYDATGPGLAALNELLSTGSLSATERARVVTRQRLAQDRFDAHQDRYEQSSTRLLRSFRQRPPHSWQTTILPALAAARAREQDEAWPPPNQGTPQRAAWNETPTAATAKMLMQRGVAPAWALASCTLPQVQEARFEAAPFAGWDALLGAHWASFPETVTATNPRWAMHAAAHNGSWWTVTHQDLLDAVQVHGDEYRGTRGPRGVGWRLLGLCGPVSVLYPQAEPGMDRMRLREGTLGVDPQGDLIVWEGAVPDLKPA